MPKSNEIPVKLLADRLTKLALELNFVEPGKDAGLLPINCFISEIEDALRGQPAPVELAQAVRQARQWLDKLFDTTVAFDASTIAQLGEWQPWMASAIECWQNQQPAPSLPPSWGGAGAGAATDQTMPGSAISSPAASSAAIPGPADGAELALILNLESDQDLLREFINESQEHLQNIENGVLVLEENPKDADTLNSIFRAFHTFKGGSGFLNLTAIKNLAHELESLLDAARQHKLVIDSAIIDLILDGGDTLKQFVAEISVQLGGHDAGQEILVPTRRLIERVKAVLSGDANASSPAHPDTVAQATPSAETPELRAAGNVPGPTALEARGIAESAAGAAVAAAPPPLIPSGQQTKQGASSVPPGNGAGFVKVDTVKLDALIDLVGELVIAESMVVQDPEIITVQSRNLARNLAQLRRVTSELQRTAMALRMVPVRSTFQKMTRVVRDLAAKQHKQVQLILSGEDTELDRNIVEELSDPLVHMMRNAVDHGVETPAARKARGKPELGAVHLRAFHQGGNIVVQIQDDGNGLNKERLLAKAREKGIIKPTDNLSEKEICDLIFAPGFSTAEQVTDISGRGVGMDVVRRNIEKLRGKVEIDTVTGQGTTFTIYLPLTLAIIDGMIVSVGGERFIIPTLSVRESFRPKPETISTVHERGEMVNVRGRLSPLLRLHQYFDQPPKVTDPAQGIIIVVESGAQTRCLMVDELLGKQEVVIKSLGGALKKNAALAGGAVLGDGRVGLILNVDALVKLSATPGLVAA